MTPGMVFLNVNEYARTLQTVADGTFSSGMTLIG
jgi:hypothetical protein